MKKLAEQNELETKATAYNKLIPIVNNAITYMLAEAQMNEDEVAEYICTSVNMLHAIDEEDANAIATL